MNRWLAVLFAAVIVFGATPIALDTPTATAQEDEVNDAPPGARVSSVFGVQSAGINSAIEIRAFRTRMDAADTPAARARVVADAVNRTETRLVALESRIETLRAARENGSIGTDTYAVRVAPITADARALGGLVGGIETASEDLDAGTLREAGVTRDRIETVAARIDRVVAADKGAIGADGLDREFYRKLAIAADAYNREIAGSNLGVLGSYLGGERINLHVVTGDGDTEVVSLRMTEGNRVRDLRAGPHPDATLRVTTDESTARQLVNSEAPRAAASQAFLDGAIRIDGLGLYNTIKWVLINVVMGVIRTVVGVIGGIDSLL